MVMLFGFMGYSARAAHSGFEALEAVDHELPDVVIMDLIMPGMNGWELSRRLRLKQATRRTLFVALTGCEGKQYRRRSAEAGIDLHLIKPIPMGTLQEVIEHWVTSDR
jgi:two-component system CheB/CheR fusion protein